MTSQMTYEATAIITDNGVQLKLINASDIEPGVYNFVISWVEDQRGQSKDEDFSIYPAGPYGSLRTY